LFLYLFLFLSLFIYIDLCSSLTPNGATAYPCSESCVKDFNNSCAAVCEESKFVAELFF
jgi:hypothetical protein